MANTYGRNTITYSCSTLKCGGITISNRWFSQLPVVAPRSQSTGHNIHLWVRHIQASASAKEKVILLHRRLGYPSFLLKNMYTQFFEKLPVHKLVCDACQLVKLKRNLYPHEENRFQASFQLIHCDRSGPSPHTDVYGFRWLAICVDDHSRFCWLYQLRQETEVIKLLENFSYLIKR